ncbi:MAG TPA: tetratricopeptide repeat protein [Gemmatimonadales bacterium]|nr:tetratricopeptide repeat protein [Gemmatimonadales bacterium]
MRRLKARAVGTLVGAGLMLAGTIGIARSSHESASDSHPIPTQARIRDLDIEFYQRRIARDPRSAGDYTRLAGLFLQRSRERDDAHDVLRAESTARHSLALRTGRNAAAFGVLASSLMAQHRFSDALQVTRRLLADDSASVAARSLLAEIQLELGQYDEAGRTLGSLVLYSNDLSVAPRLARWEELHGRPERARQLLRRARDEASGRHGMLPEQIAWFHLRLADLALRHGHFSEAERELRSGLQVAPRDHRLLATLARLEANRHNWDRAIDAGERAMTIALDPATLGLLSEAYAAKGDSARSSEYFRSMQAAVARDLGPYHRAWSVFLLDHGREVDAVLARAAKELETRRDIFGYDLLAWALHKAGRNREARGAIDQALVLGTRDAALLYHAGVIERALGNDLAAKAYLGAALETNPRWDAFQPAAARMTLDSIAAEGKAMS